jgi:hypothetical protein
LGNPSGCGTLESQSRTVLALGPHELLERRVVPEPSEVMVSMELRVSSAFGERSAQELQSPFLVA